ncbi:helix-turn-helix domain-containing protein [Protofrankia symbiont of Coriaria ruscifolia]|uniref:helix-turn-helix domain-containing protein n=1 Tax=Protofrankia symbiont of Coriaria ruscifolia TaxID=1306542 RepID=UPI001040FFF3|nr:helix-turn-helix transcriptional regulator [Protofrankia symbiont of Coriaria ruscifolia]
MEGSSSGRLIERARLEAGLSGAEMARLAHTSRPTLAAYEHGSKSPTLATAERLLAVAGFRLDIVPVPGFQVVNDERGRPFVVPDRLPRLPVTLALARVRLPVHLGWSDPARIYDLSDRQQRQRVYEIVLREGQAEDIQTYIDGALLIDAWRELVLPAAIRRRWEQTVLPP